MNSADDTYWRIVFSKQFPYILMMSAIIFVLSLTDYSIPSLFQTNVYAMEIFSDYSASGQSVHSLFLSLPMIMTGAIVIIPAVISLRKSGRPMPDEERVIPKYSRLLSTFSYIAITVLVLQIILPLISIIPDVKGVLSDNVAVFEELFNSFKTGILSVIIMLVLSLPLTYLLAVKTNKKDGFKTLIWILCLLPLAIPGVLNGIGVLKLISDSPLHNLRNSIFMPALGLAIRYLPFSLIIQYGAYMRIDLKKLEAADLLKRDRIRSFFKAYLPLLSPGIIISSITVFLLTLGDVSTSLILMPAGKEPLSVKIYNYLHYGSSATVARLCIIQIICCLSLMAVLYFLMFHRKHYNRNKRNTNA